MTGTGGIAAQAPGETPGGRVRVGRMLFDPITEAGCVDAIVEASQRGRGGVVVTANLDHLRRYPRDAEYRAIADGADLLVADGMPIVWASRLGGRPLPERVAGSSLTLSLSRAAGRAGLSVALVGGNPGVAEQAGRVLERDNPGLRVALTECPPMGFDRDEAAVASLADRIDSSAADLVYVALGSPKQEKLIARLRAAGVLPRAWWIGVGISLSFVTGEVSRAPGWMQRAGLEWVHRLGQEPGRLARRYLVDGLPFAAALFAGEAWGRVRGR